MEIDLGAGSALKYSNRSKTHGDSDSSGTGATHHSSNGRSVKDPTKLAGQVKDDVVSANAHLAAANPSLSDLLADKENLENDAASKKIKTDEAYSTLMDRLNSQISALTPSVGDASQSLPDTNTQLMNAVKQLTMNEPAPNPQQPLVRDRSAAAVNGSPQNEYYNNLLHALIEKLGSLEATT